MKGNVEWLYGPVAPRANLCTAGWSQCQQCRLISLTSMTRSHEGHAPCVRRQGRWPGHDSGTHCRLGHGVHKQQVWLLRSKARLYLLIVLTLCPFRCCMWSGMKTGAAALGLLFSV